MKSDHGPYCSPLIQQILGTSAGSKKVKNCRTNIIRNKDFEIFRKNIVNDYIQYISKTYL